MEELVRRLIHEQHQQSMEKTRLSEIVRRYFGPLDGVELGERERFGFRVMNLERHPEQDHGQDQVDSDGRRQQDAGKPPIRPTYARYRMMPVLWISMPAGRGLATRQSRARSERYPESDPGSWSLEALRLAEAVADDFVREVADWSALYDEELPEP